MFPYHDMTISVTADNILTASVSVDEVRHSKVPITSYDAYISDSISRGHLLNDVPLDVETIPVEWKNLRNKQRGKTIQGLTFEFGILVENSEFPCEWNGTSSHRWWNLRPEGEANRGRD